MEIGLNNIFLGCYWLFIDFWDTFLPVKELWSSFGQISFWGNFMLVFQCEKFCFWGKASEDYTRGEQLSLVLLTRSHLFDCSGIWAFYEELTDFCCFGLACSLYFKIIGVAMAFDTGFSELITLISKW